MKAKNIVFAFIGYELVAYLINRSQMRAVMPLDLIGALIGYGTPAVAPAAATATASLANPLQVNFASGLQNVITGVEGFVS